MPKHPVLVFDFDGTLVDSLDSIVAKVNRVAARLHRKPYTEEQVEHFISSDSRKFFQKYRLTRWLLSLGQNLIEREQSSHLAEFEVVPKLEQVLKMLDHHQIKMGIVTSNSQVLVKRFLKLKQWDNFFSFVYGGGGIFGKSQLLQEMLTSEKFSASQVIYIGDEPRDVEAAKSAGLKVAAVTWGYQPKKAFASLKPDWLITKPSELLHLVNLQPWWRRLF